MRPGWVCWCRCEHRLSPLVCERGEEQDAGALDALSPGCGALAAHSMDVALGQQGGLRQRLCREISLVQRCHGRMLCSLEVSFVES